MSGGFSDLRPRAVTAGLLVAATLLLLVLPQFVQTLVLLVWAAFVLREGAGLVAKAETSARLKLGFMLGLGLGLVATLWLVGLRQGLFILVVSAWIFDVGAYLGGRLLGGRKLAPEVSPGKTWSGTLVGAGLLAAGLFFLGLGWTVLIIAPLMAAVMQLGDLAQSWVKRRAGVKDSGTILPGHGGWLDRYDGLLAAAPVWVLLLEFWV